MQRRSQCLQRLGGLGAVLLLSACAGLAPAPPVAPVALLADARFAPAPAGANPVAGDELFALSPAMRKFIGDEIEPRLRRKGPQRALLEALYTQGTLGIVYDAAQTRSAAQTFEARAGNCLSLVLMTAAFAKALDLDVVYQSAIVDDTWRRSGDLLLVSGHVNLTIGRRQVSRLGGLEIDNLTVDFLPPAELRGLRTRVIEEHTVRAMFMNNRAAEALVQGAGDDQAYWWARAAVQADPGFMAAYNTLGVIYLRRGLLAEADAMFGWLLARAPDDRRALANRIQVLDRLGRSDDAQALRLHLARVEPVPPFQDFERGREALQRGELQRARAFFARELERGGEGAEIHHLLAITYARLGDPVQAARQLALAVAQSRDGTEQARYGAKLARLRGSATP